MGVLPGIVLAAAKIFPGATRVWQRLCPALMPNVHGNLAALRMPGNTHISLIQ